MVNSKSISGLELSEKYFHDAVKPIIENHFSSLGYSCGLIGTGSEVLGFDDETSHDHNWGPRLILFLSDSDYTEHRERIDRVFKQHLPNSFYGFSTNFSDSNKGDRLLIDKPSGEINHFIEIVTIKDYFEKILGLDVYKELEASDWLSFPQQILLSIQSGRVFYDKLGLNSVRDKLAWYPHDAWLYMIASSWRRIGQEEHLAGRAMMTDQDIGFSVIASRLVREIMQLGFLYERKYAPYAKWLEKAFLNLECSKSLASLLNTIVSLNGVKVKQQALCDSFEYLASMHNKLSISRPVIAKCTYFHNRPFNVINGEKIAKIISAAITDSTMKSFVGANGLIGNIDQISDNTDVLENPKLRRKMIWSAIR